jgi:ectoine hydroxylase-related dioxygenase (phytanoyl-CoA dioxygenase family)
MNQNLIGLTADMKKAFEKDAFLHIKQPLFKPEDFMNLRNYLLAYVLALPENLRGTYFTGNPAIRRPYYQDWVTAPPLVNLAEQILGQDLAYFNFAICYKPPRSDFRVGPHIDSHYWIETGCIDPSQVLTIFVPLTPIKKDQGCLRVVPGLNEYKMYSHRKLEKDNNYFHWEINDPNAPLQKMIDVEMDENEVCLMKSGLIHESGSNSGSEHRLGLTVRYISASAKYTPIKNDLRKMILLKGQNLAGNEYHALNSKEFVGGFSWSK